MRGKFSEVHFPHFERDVQFEMEKLELKLAIHQAKIRYTRFKIVAGLADIVANVILAPFKPPSGTGIIGIGSAYVDAKEIELNLRFEPLYFLQEAKSRFAQKV